MHQQQHADVTLGNVLVFTLDAITLWSGRRHLKREDLKVVSDDELPPGTLASLGSKKIIDPEEISDFESLKKEAHRECGKIGVRFLGGYAVPVDEAKDLGAKLDGIGAKFAAKKAQFLADYDTKVSDWVKKHPEWSAMLRQAALNKADVDVKLQFGYSAFKVAATHDDAANPLTQGLAAEVGGLAGQLYQEIAQAAGEVMEKSLLGRDRVTQKILSPIRSIRKKLFGLSFLDKRVKPLIDTIDHIVTGLPPAGHIDGIGLTAIHGLIFILSSVDRMQAHGDLILNGKTVQEATEESIPALVPEDVEEEVAAPVAEDVPVALPAADVQPTAQALAPQTEFAAAQVAPTPTGTGQKFGHTPVMKLRGTPPVRRIVRTATI